MAHGIYAPDGSQRVTVVSEEASDVTGAIDDTAETDPSENATVIALLKGILTVLNSHTTLLTDIETNTST